MPYFKENKVEKIKKNDKIWTLSYDINENQKVYTYDEAIDLTGNGTYSISLLIVLSIATLGMGIDLFGFSVIVAGATSEFKLDLQQTNLLLSLTFIGPILMSYAWGYIADTQGRKKSLLISLWGSFIISTLSAFSHNWIVLGVLKLLSTSFSSCVQSTTYTLLGESCPRRYRDGYILVMTSVLDFCIAFYIGVAYGILNLDFSYNLILIQFTPWRLLTIALASVLGIAAIGVLFFYESPKFLLNAGHEDEAVNIMKNIWKLNGGRGKYHIKRVHLNEEGNRDFKDSTFWESLWMQIVPLFKPPLLWRTIQLYILTFMMYGTSNSYFMWFPFLAEKFIEGIGSASENQTTGLCNMVVSGYDNIAKNNISNSIETPLPNMKIEVFWASLVQGTVFVIILFCIAKIAHRKRTLMIIILTFSCICGILAVTVPDNIFSFIMFSGQLTNELTIGIIYSYFVDLYPTSYRGMASCLATMIARLGSICGVSILGTYVMTQCSASFFVTSALMIVGILITLLLPRDRSNTK